MFPFSLMTLQRQQFELLVPGQDSPSTIIRYATSNAYCGLRFNASGVLETRGEVGSFYVATLTDSWIEALALATLDPSRYEARFQYLSGDGVDAVQGNANNTWFGCDTSPEWYVRSTIPLATVEVQGIFSVRDTLDPVNSQRAGDITLRAVNLLF